MKNFSRLPQQLLSTCLGIFIGFGFILLAKVAIAEVVINEIHYHPREDQLNREFIELLNTGSEPVDLSGWEFDQGVNFTFPAGTVIEAQSFLVVARNELSVRSAYTLSSEVKTVGNYAPNRLSNDGETLRLQNAEGRTIDRVEYNDVPPWPIEADGQGASLELVHPGVDNALSVYWKASIIPTPGRANSQAVAQRPPQALQVIQEPQAPTSSDPVTLSVRFAEDDALQSIFLNLQNLSTGQRQTLAMEQADTEAHYRVQLPAQPDGTTVEYTLSITGENGFALNLPANADQSGYIFQVDDSPIPAGSIVINEIMYNNPVLLDDDEEWVELYNPEPSTIDLSQWILRDSNEANIFRLPAGTALEPGSSLMIATTRNPQWPGLVIDGLPFSLGNDGDEVRLLDPNGRLINHVEYNDSDAWPEGADGTGRSLELLQASRPNHESNNWSVSIPVSGTPNQPNSRRITDPNYRDFEVVINELFYNPIDEEFDNNIEKEYVELHNRGDRPVDVGDWFFSDGIEFQIPTGTVIPAEGYLLVAKSMAEHPNVPNKVGNFVLRLNNGGENVAIRNREGVVIDAVDYNDRFPWPALADGQGRSLALMAPWADNSKAQFWQTGAPTSPGQPNRQRLRNAPPRIRNVDHTPPRPMAMTSESRTETETILRLGETVRFFKGLSEPPADWNTLNFDDSAWLSGSTGLGYGDDDDATVLNDMRNGYLSVYTRAEFTLNNLDELTSLQLRLDYDDSFVAYINGEEVTRANVSGSPPRYNDSADGNHEAGTFETFPVPLEGGPVREGRNVLAIQGHNVDLDSSDFSLRPELETGRTLTSGEAREDTIVITAQVEDPDGVRQVVFHYQRLFAPLGTGLIMDEWFSAPMHDDGTNGDAVAGDTFYTVRLNDVTTVRPRDIFRYHIEAQDNLGPSIKVPRPDEATRHFALFVRDGGNLPDFPTLHLFIENRFYQELRQDPQTNVERPALVVIDGEVFDLTHDGGVRFNGENQRNQPKKSWKIEFAKGKKWNGQREINLNANFLTSPLLRGESGFLERMAFQLFRDLGFATPDTMHRRMTLNNSFYGLFLQVEEYNKDFLGRHDLPQNTKIYQAGVEGRPARMTPEPNFASYARKYEFVLGRDEAIDGLITFIEALNDAEDKKAFLHATVDIAGYVDYLAAVALLSHLDSTEKNYFPMQQGDGTWRVLPWNLSHTWGALFDNDSFPLVAESHLLDGADGGKFGPNRLREVFLGVEEFRERYYQRLSELATSLFTVERLGPQFDHVWEQIQAPIAENTQRWNSPGQLDRMVEALKSYVEARRQFILNNEGVRPPNRPARPVNQVPADRATVATRSPVLAVQGIGSGPFAAAEWMLQEGEPVFHQPLWRALIEPDGWNSIDVPNTILAGDSVYYWRMRWKETADGAWSDWSEPTAFTTGSLLPVPDVQNVQVTALNESARITWDLPKASDLLRVDIFDGNVIVESTPIGDNQVRIRDLTNNELHLFTIHTVAKDRRQSPGVLVRVTPQAPLVQDAEIAYFRFEDTLQDQTGRFTGDLLSNAAIGPPGAQNPIPLTQAENLSALQLDGQAGSAFRFGGNEPELDADDELTIETYARLNENAAGPMILLDRFRENGAVDDQVWRFGVGLSSPGSLDFFFNDGDSLMGFDGRLHFASAANAFPADEQFHHLAVVAELNNSTFFNKIRLFLDGKLVPLRIIHDDGFSDYESFRTESDAPILVGARLSADGTTNVWDGRLDEVRLINGAVDSQQFLAPFEFTPVDTWMMY